MLGEFLTAALGQNPMLWRTSPIGTELETVVVGWLREALGLPDTFDGLLTDTASTSTLIALAAAREASGLDAAARGLAARADDRRASACTRRPRPTARSRRRHDARPRAAPPWSKIPVNDDFEMDAEALADGDRRQTTGPGAVPSRSSPRSARRRRPPSTRSP